MLILPHHIAFHEEIHGSEFAVELRRRGNPLPDGTVEIDSKAMRALCDEFNDRSAPLVKNQPFGLGDAVAAVAQPIARAIDAVAGTNIAECGGCKKRREFLNNLTR